MQRSSVPFSVQDVSKPATSSAWPALVKELPRAPGEFLTYSPIVSKVIPIPYPITVNGEPIPPDGLWRYSQSHSFELPRCFHDSEAHIHTYTDSCSPLDGHTVASCGERRGQQCPFFFSITAVVKSPFFPRIHKCRPTPRSTHPGFPHLSGRADRGRENIAVTHPEMPQREGGSGSPDDPIEVPDETSDILCHERGAAGTEADPIVVAESTPDLAQHTIPVRPTLAHFGKHGRDTHAGGALRSIWDLRGGGLSYAEFTKMFVQCRACKNVVMGDYLDRHICDLDAS
ncbi:hypothetical protein ONZ45_g8578 [Pleurotus djamor]|nr:hypothetical protein ONZ45_g8578 [Pleurotus djamor]